MEYSIVVPVYNSTKTLEELFRRIVTVMEALGKGFEIIFVDDGSTDESWQVIQKLAETDSRLTAIQLMRNYGQANATLCGLQHSEGQMLVTIDDDLQHPPEEISVLVKAMEENPNTDVIMGIPDEKQHPMVRRLGSSCLNLMNSLMFTRGRGTKFSSFRIMTRPVVDHLLAIDTPHPAPGPLLYSITPRIMNVYVKHQPRAAGKSGYTFPKLYRLTLSRFLSFSTFPLRFLAIVGVIGILLSILLGTVYSVKYIQGEVKVAGWTTLVLLLILLSGFNFFAFGIVGEYLLRILQSAYGTPQYQIRRKTGKREAIAQDHRETEGNHVR
jgi:dolichol-phosphate mannosyltransferase/undecaprenyl-phosphate 4-deoxy-4-formamido-L-arabinose transferase